MPTPVPRRKPPCDSYGDVNDDGYVTYAPDDKTTDGIIVAHYTVYGWEGVRDYTPLTEEEFKRRADVNGDGKVDVTDAYMISRYAVGLEDTFPVCPRKKLRFEARDGEVLKGVEVWINGEKKGTT